MRTLHGAAALLLLCPLAACGSQLVGFPDDEPRAVPSVIETVPVDQADDVRPDEPLSAVFDQFMAPDTVLTGLTLRRGTTDVSGAVSYSGVTAVFQPDAPLAFDTDYVARVTTAVTTVAGVALERDHAWTFRTGSVATPAPGAPYVVFTGPEDREANVPVGAEVVAVFSERMLGTTITDDTFVLTDGASPVDGEIRYAGVTATFTPTWWLDADTEYTATITEAAEDLDGDTLLADHEWTFSTADLDPGPQPVALRSLSSFVAVAGAGLTSSNSLGTTTLNGDVGLSPTPSCTGDGSPCTQGNPVINGTLYAADPNGVAAQAKVDLTDALVDALARPPGTVVEDLAGLTLPPGIYTSDSTMSVAVGGTVVLDGEGDANAVWIFQVGSSLTVGNNVQVVLINGAAAKNVFWAAAASSTLGTNVSFQGTVLAQESNSVGTDSSVVGRLLCTEGEITLLSNTITLPPQ